MLLVLGRAPSILEMSPLARCGCGSSQCTCSVTAGPGVTVDGNGSPASPFVISAEPAEVACEDVRPCLSAGPGVAYDPATGVIGTRLSTDAGNNLIVGGDDGLFVPATAGGTVATGCGLAGDGSAGTPLTAATGTWPYPCPVDDNAGAVYCDSTGTLRSEPRPAASYAQDIVNEYPIALVPAAYPTVVATRELTLTNPDACRDAFVIIETEIDVDIDMPPGSRATFGIPGDEMMKFGNAGSATIFDHHTQLTKVFSLAIPAGGTATAQVQIAVGNGSGGAEYNKVQSFIRAFIFVL